ncbi:MAG: hypothetical protein INR62_13370, partial [Rhodospirillales bacterium]|nr:hypothetical protein [Acetobacter sp.]
NGLDAQLAASFAQQRTVLQQRLGASIQPTLDMFNMPEYRVGLLLTAGAMSTGVYVVVSTLAGGLAGLVLRRRRA